LRYVEVDTFQDQETILQWTNESPKIKQSLTRNINNPA